MIVAADLNRFVVFDNREQTLVGRMGREECLSVEDVEEGEISDSASVEEITEEDFTNKQEAATKAAAAVDSNDPSQRVWTLQELLKYRASMNYSGNRVNHSGNLMNFAWAHAVQNKPPDQSLVVKEKEVKPSEDISNLKRSSPSSSVSGNEDNKTSNGSSGSLNNKVIIDVSGDEDEDLKMEDVGGEKEEGELEEGEIDLDSDDVWSVEDGESKSNDVGINELDTAVEENELEKRVDSIREALETVTISDANKSYEAVCSRLQKSLESLRGLVAGNSVSTADALVKRSFIAMQTLNSVFCSMNQNQKEQNKGILSRLLSHVTNQNPSIFSPVQIKEIELMIPSELPVMSPVNSRNKEKMILHSEKASQNHYDTSSDNISHDLTDSSKRVSESMSVETLLHNDGTTLMETLKVGPSSSKGRGMLLPLIDLHKDHDEESLPSPSSSKGRGMLLPLIDLHKDHEEGSLPSPTRATPSLLPINKALAVGGQAVKPEWPVLRAAHEAKDIALHPYETDALKAVSFYQQKFGRSSFFTTDRLPSPTPSEEADDADGDSVGEVSSSSIVNSVKSVNVPILAQSVVSSGLNQDFSFGQGQVSVRNAGPVSLGANNALKSSAKSRDPRLRVANPDVGALDLHRRPMPMFNNDPKVVAAGVVASSRKQKPSQQPILDGPAMKRQRNGLTYSEVIKDVQTVSGSGAWLEDSGVVGPQLTSSTIQNTGGDPWKVESAVTSSGIGSGMPNIATTGNDHLAGTGTSTTASLESLLKEITVNPAVWMNIIKMEQQKSVHPAKSSSQNPSSNSVLGADPSTNVTDSKPLVLGQKSSGILQTPQTASVNDSVKIRMKSRDPRRILHSNAIDKGGSLAPDQTTTNAAPTTSSHEVKGNLNSQAIAPPDITRQFTKNLKNIADLISVTQASMAPPVVPQIPSSQPMQVHSSVVDVNGVVPEAGNLQTVAIASSEEVAAGPPRSQNAWGDVERLFEGFDDQQKAAIHKERARRIEEQKKMFSARKLCLVLDLDHTLLNSAKFAEVDPAHDEILRKKEEQDREKPYRHLFRFPHMGMWTKLRPGIWNFLEKASKLFEMHLYTMGNKLYATEMAKLLDPKGVLFAGRVISRGDDSDLFDGEERVPKNKDLEGVLGMESDVVIIDDSIRVWPHNKLNLIVVERYIYFPCSRRQFGLLGPSLLEIDHDERTEDGTLASSLAVIERIHQNFFSHQSLDEADVRNILASEQRKILSGCRIVFSRVFPVGEANPHLHPLWQTAEQFGAVCMNQIDEQVTHVVANSLGTDKVNWALSTGRFVVHPGWVEASALLYRRANELDFAIKP